MLISPYDIIIYTDGSIYPNPGGNGGIGVLIIYPDTGEREEYSEGFTNTTNNRMELQAAIFGAKKVPVGKSAILYTDSQYVSRGITEWLPTWKKNGMMTSQGKPVINVDLWEEFELAIKGKSVAIRWCRGHNGNEHNERADQLALQGRLSVS